MTADRVTREAPSAWISPWPHHPFPHLAGIEALHSELKEFERLRTLIECALPRGAAAEPLIERALERAEATRLRPADALRELLHRIQRRARVPVPPEGELLRSIRAETEEEAE